MSESRCFSVKQAAKYIAIPENTLRSWIRLQKVPCIRANGRVLLDRNILDNWLDERAVPEVAATTG